MYVYLFMDAELQVLFLLPYEVFPCCSRPGNQSLYAFLPCIYSCVLVVCREINRTMTVEDIHRNAAKKQENVIIFVVQRERDPFSTVSQLKRKELSLYTCCRTVCELQV
mmetsp:Transcript_17837/g.29320  ORF Transcript_17837/g.29320 Transcript_17837/m.29320 type:complete len:109 (+) Transcript_17837:30-356(+)